MDFVIAVDGAAASGKGTLAARLAAEHGLPHLDTGLLYRAVGRGVRRDGGDPADAAAATAAATALELSGLDDPELTTAPAGEAASQVAAHAGVRAALYDLQRRFALQAGGAVLDGRDIGTVIAPEAAAKLYVDADLAVRARRRWLQVSARGDTRDLQAVADDLARRRRGLARHHVHGYSGGRRRGPPHRRGCTRPLAGATLRRRRVIPTRRPASFPHETSSVRPAFVGGDFPNPRTPGRACAAATGVHPFGRRHEHGHEPLARRLRRAP